MERWVWMERWVETVVPGQKTRMEISAGKQPIGNDAALRGEVYWLSAGAP
jgi:hypothetical protein